ncbi:MAG: single-stranded DNA-binding protein [Planctomycetota bacterium]|jgi:single-strand DNA-binding protein
MADFNKVILLGRLTRDPELKYTNSGMAVAEIGLAVGRRYFNKQTNQQVEESNFIDCTAFGKQAETLNQYMKKGRPLFVEGRLKFDSWQNKEGQRRSKLSVVIENFQFIDGGGGGGGGGNYDRNRGESAQSSGSMGRNAPQVQAGKVSDGHSSGHSSGGGNRGGEEYDFEDIPF